MASHSCRQADNLTRERICARLHDDSASAIETLRCAAQNIAFAATAVHDHTRVMPTRQRFFTSFRMTACADMFLSLAWRGRRHGVLRMLRVILTGRVCAFASDLFWHFLWQFFAT